MPSQKFQENISFLDKSDQQFGNFLQQIKTRQNIRQMSRQRHQQKNQKSDTQFNLQSNTKIKQFEANPEEIVQLKNYYSQNQQNKNLLQKNLDTHQIYKNQDKFFTKNLTKINTNSSKIFQDEKIKKQRSNQLIQLKSGNQLPSWLFQHIRKKNVNRLKNVYANNHQEKSPQLSENNYKGQDNNRQRARSGQRYLNSSYVLKNDSKYSEKQYNMFSQQRSYNLKKQSRKKMNQYSSFQSRNISPKKSKTNRQTQNQKIKPEVYLNDYSYNYLPEDSGFQDKQINGFYLSKRSSQQSHSPKYKHQRVIQQMKVKQKKLQKRANESSSFSMRSARRRQKTISEDDPLIEPKRMEFKS